MPQARMADYFLTALIGVNAHHALANAVTMRITRRQMGNLSNDTDRSTAEI